MSNAWHQHDIICCAWNGVLEGGSSLADVVVASVGNTLSIPLETPAEGTGRSSSNSIEVSSSDKPELSSSSSCLHCSLVVQEPSTLYQCLEYCGWMAEKVRPSWWSSGSSEIVGKVKWGHSVDEVLYHTCSSIDYGWNMTFTQSTTHIFLFFCIFRVSHLYSHVTYYKEYANFTTGILTNKPYRLFTISHLYSNQYLTLSWDMVRIQLEYQWDIVNNLYGFFVRIPVVKLGYYL